MVLEISSVTGTANLGGLTQPIIGQRRIEHETRLADGDVNLLGGILEDSETRSLSGYPWISKIPILKYLFAQENKERRENEIVFAITPHIVRAQEITDDNLRVVDVGTGSLTELRRKEPAPEVPRAEHPTGPGSPRPSPLQTPPATSPAPGPSGPATPPQASPQNEPGASR
jgi:general secretion pathway protein D